AAGRGTSQAVSTFALKAFDISRSPSPAALAPCDRAGPEAPPKTERTRSEPPVRQANCGRLQEGGLTASFAQHRVVASLKFPSLSANQANRLQIVIADVWRDKGSKAHRESSY